MAVPCPPHVAARSSLALLMLAGLLLIASPGHANEAAHSAAAAPKASAAPAEPAAGLPPGKDPLDHLRERLAEKLGGESKPKPSKTAPTTVKVTNKADGPPAAHGAATHVAPVARAHRPAPPSGETVAKPDAAPDAAARIAAIHREAGQAAAALPGHVATEHAAHWDYQGEGGPQAWGQLKSDYATCASGKRQSPIDIRDGLKLELDPVQFNYQPSNLRVVDNGHTVQVNVGAGNSIEVMGRRYELLQFHFHRPSEERIDGRQFDMVAHLVHKDIDGRLAVVAVLLNRGAAQPLIQTVWNNLPLEKGEEQAVRAPVDLNVLLPTERNYYTYMGSLTTPPCTEGVLWMVMKTPVPVSVEQIGIFSRLYPMNARPLQSASGRLIKESN